MHMIDNQFKQPADAMVFMLAGNATITAQSRTTGRHFTYKVQKAKPDPRYRGVSWFVRLKTDGSEAYRYIGLLVRADHQIAGQFKFKSSRVNGPSIAAFEYICKHLLNETRMPPGVDLWHEGKCGRCGRKLTRPDSIATGMGPECVGKED